MSGWGGKRENSGRKSKLIKDKPISIYLNEDEKKILEGVDKNRTKAVKILLDFYLNLKK